MTMQRKILLAVVGTAAISLICIVTFGASSVNQSLIHFWLNDTSFGPLTGFERIFIYGGLLALMLVPISFKPLGNSPLKCPDIWNFTLPEFRALDGLLLLVFNPKTVNVTWLYLVRNVTLLSWICCIVGFGGQLPPIITGFGVLVLHGFCQPMTHCNHRWYVPVYTLCALMFCNHSDDWSLDRYLQRTWSLGSLYATPAPSPAAKNSLLASSFCKKSILVANISTLFFGGISKLVHGGLRWMDGHTLAYHMDYKYGVRHPTVIWFKQLASRRYVWISCVLSVGSMIFECGSVVIIFCTGAVRPMFVTGQVLFHLGIYLVMLPNYFPQVLCCFLLINVNYQLDDNPTVTGLESVSSIVMVILWASTFWFLFTAFAVLLKFEIWPIATIPMYAFLRNSKDFSHAHLKDEGQAFALLEEAGSYDFPFLVNWSRKWFQLRLVNMADPTEHVKLEIFLTSLDYGVKGLLRSHLKNIVNRVVIRDIQAKCSAGVLWSMHDRRYPAQEWLHNYRHVFVEALKGRNLPDYSSNNAELQIVCHTKESDIVLASIEWPRS